MCSSDLATRLIRSGLGLTRLPVVALTAGALVEERRRTLAAGMNGFISKPIDPDSLVRTLRRVVEEGRQGAWPIRNLAASASVTTSVAALPGVARPATLSVPPVPAVAGDAWPTVDGIDAASTAQRLNHDAGLFRKILGWLLRDFADLGREPVRLPPQAQARRALALRLHKLRGSAANVGAVGVQQHAAAAELGLRQLIDASTIDASTVDASTAAADPVLATQQSLDALSAALRALEVASASALALPAAAQPQRQAQAEAESA